MSIIANLAVQLGARTEKFDTNIAKAKKTSQDFSSVFSGAGIGGLSKSVPVLAAVAVGLGGLKIAGDLASSGISAVRNEMQAIDETADTAKRLGMSYSELIVARRSLSESSGLDDSAIDKSMQKLQLNLSEASQGTGDLHGLLSRLGVDAGELLRMGPTQQMQILSEATKQLKNPTDQMRLAFELFGKEGAGLAESLREGPGHMKEMANWSEKWGLTLTQAQTEQVGAANDAWQKVNDIATGTVRQIAAEFAPVMTVVAESIIGAAEPFSTLQDIVPYVIDQGAQFAGIFYDIGELVVFTYTSLDKIAHLDFSGLGEGMKEALDFETGTKFVDKIQQARKEAADSVKGSNRDAESMFAQFEKEKQAAEEMRKLEEQRIGRQNEKLATLKEEVEMLAEIKRLTDSGLSEKAAKDIAEQRKALLEFGSGPGFNEFLQLQMTKQRLLAKDKENPAESARHQSTSLISAGSREAWRFLADLQKNERNAQLDKMEEQRKLAEEQLATQRESLARLEMIRGIGRAR